MNLHDFLAAIDARRRRDAERFAEHDRDLCMLCGAHGVNKRSLFISCLCNINEVLPEAIDLFCCEADLRDRGWYLRICKRCRARLLAHLQKWREDCIMMRKLSKDHDGYVLVDEDAFDEALSALEDMAQEEYRKLGKHLTSG